MLTKNTPSPENRPRALPAREPSARCALKTRHPLPYISGMPLHAEFEEFNDIDRPQLDMQPDRARRPTRTGRETGLEAHRLYEAHFTPLARGHSRDRPLVFVAEQARASHASATPSRFWPGTVRALGRTGNAPFVLPQSFGHGS